MANHNEHPSLLRRDASLLAARLAGLAGVYLVFFAAYYTSVWQPDRTLTAQNNVQIEEAQAWLDGSMALPARRLDTAVRDGRVYNHFPPLVTFLGLAVLPWSPEGVPFILLSILFVLPIPALAYVLFLQRCDSVVGAMVMAIAFVLGTSAFCLLNRVQQSASSWYLNQGISQLGLLLFLIDYFGARRFWLGGIGLLVCGWSRLPMMMYVVPYLWWHRWGNAKRHSRSVLGAAAFAMVLVGAVLLLNTLKFGHPLDTGYGRIYEGRDDRVAVAARDGIFSPRHVTENLYWMNVGPPSFEKRHGRWRWRVSEESTGIWWTTPILLYLFVDARRIWREKKNRWLLAAVGVIFSALMLYHHNGWPQRGYNRFSMDFVLVLLALVAPQAMRGRRRYVTLLLTGWSVTYFVWIVA